MEKFNKTEMKNSNSSRTLGYAIFNATESLEQYVELEKEKLKFEIHKFNLNYTELKHYKTDFFEK